MYRFGSTSSIWGSANSHLGSDGERRYTSMDSLPGNGAAPVTLDITRKSGHSAQLVGSRGVVCKTQAEYKANKLNRNEQTKLENVQFRVVKEMELSQRKFTQSEKSIRAKSARLMGRIRNIERASYTEAGRPRSFAYEKDVSTKQPKSEPANSEQVKKKGPCDICQKIQNIIFTYEHEGARVGVIDDETDHSMCVFSDVQVNTFIRLLESKYFGKIPSLTNNKTTSRESGTSASRLDRQASKEALISREEINNVLAKKNIEHKIQQFCEELDKINKEERNIPEEVKESVERWRIENAILLSQKPPSFHQQIINEVRRLLKI